MSDDKLLPEDSNGSCEQSKNCLTVIKNDGHVKEPETVKVNELIQNPENAAMNGCIQEPEYTVKNEENNDENGYNKESENDSEIGLASELSNMPAKEAYSADSNGNVDVTTGETQFNEDNSFVNSVDSSLENEVKEACDKLMEEVNDTKPEANEKSGEILNLKTNVEESTEDIVSCTLPSTPKRTTSAEFQTTSLEPKNQTSVTIATGGSPVEDIIPASCLEDQLPQMDSTKPNQTYREDADDSSDDDTSTFSLGSSSSDCSDSFLDKMHRNCSSPNKIPNIKTKGELDLDELPPIEDLTIDVTEREMQKIGSIYAIVDKLVIVRALKDLQPLDLDSVLFLSYKNPLGRIFDVFGPVVEPFYSVRFNSSEHIVEKSVVVDSDVFFAPEKSDITSYVFVDQLRKQKGSDASWQDNNEPPEEYLDYSDDDEERAAKRKRQAKNRSRNTENDQVIPIKVSRDAKPRNSEEINPWDDIQKYKESVNGRGQPSQTNSSHKNPFRKPFPQPRSLGMSSLNLAKPSRALLMPADRYASNPSGSMASQGGTNISMPFVSQQNHQQAQYPFRGPPIEPQRNMAALPNSYIQSQPQLVQAVIQNRPYLPMRPVQSVTPIHPPLSPLLQTVRFMHQRQAYGVPPPSHIFGQAPYFNQGLPSPLSMPPPSPTPAAFAYRSQAANGLSNFATQPANNINLTSNNSNYFNQPANQLLAQPPANHASNLLGISANQSPHFLRHGPSARNQPTNFVSQPMTLRQNNFLTQGQAGRSQWQQGPASPYGMTPLSISIPNTPPPNAMHTPVPSPYNMWGSKSLNFPQSGYFGNMQ